MTSLGDEDRKSLAATIVVVLCLAFFVWLYLTQQPAGK